MPERDEDVGAGWRAWREALSNRLVVPSALVCEDLAEQTIATREDGRYDLHPGTSVTDREEGEKDRLYDPANTLERFPYTRSAIFLNHPRYRTGRVLPQRLIRVVSCRRR